MNTKKILHSVALFNTVRASRHLPVYASVAKRSFTDNKSMTMYGILRLVGLAIIPHQEAWIVERFGKYSRTLKSGVNLVIPYVDKIAYIQSLKELAIEIPDQPAITKDNVVLQINGVLFLKIRDPYGASYGVEDAEYAIAQLAQTTMRSEIGKIQLDHVFQEREVLNISIVNAINKSSEPWGIDCLRYEIRDIKLPDKIQVAMQMQVEAERKKRASVLESEGIRDAAINRAEGEKQSRILDSEAKRTERINQALGESEAIERIAVAQANSLSKLALALNDKHGSDAVQWRVAENYIEAFSKLAKTGNTILLPSNAGDPASMIAQAMAIYGAQTLSQKNQLKDAEHENAPALSIGPTRIVN